ncbi:MAG: hypothetical protein JSR18_02995 [Proteobacteria bacterium]|nr:hypothetical protein [Pseudomonadota bacterium]
MRFTKRYAFALGMAGFMAATSVHATIFSVNLGTSAPPTTLGSYTVSPFDVTVQNAIADNASVSSLPSPIGGSLAFSTPATKFTVPTTWYTWSHGYTGAVFRFAGTMSGTDATLIMPPVTAAFYVYYEGYTFDTSEVTLTTNSGEVLGPVTVTGFGGATGLAFYSDDPHQTIKSIAIHSDDPQFMAIAEFGAAKGTVTGYTVPVPTLSPLLLAAMALLLAFGSAGALARSKR